MRKILNVAMLAVVALMSVSAHAAATPPPPVVVAKSSSAVAPAATGVIGVVGALVFYDFLRRMTCSGDFMRLGGPGFSQPMRPTDNALTPRRC